MPSIIFLRQFDYDISSVSEKHPGISDHKVIDKAKKEDRIILTFDKDYGEIIFKHATDNPPAVITFRFKGENPEFAGQLPTLPIRRVCVSREHFRSMQHEGSGYSLTQECRREEALSRTSSFILYKMFFESNHRSRWNHPSTSGEVPIAIGKRVR